MFERLREVGAEDDIDFRFADIQRANNTRDAHRLVLHAAEQDRTWAMAEALFRGYFTEGRDLNDTETLLDIASAAGLDREASAEMLASDAHAAAVHASQEIAQRSGISGVPMTIFGNQFALSGAQPVEAFVQAIQRTREAETQDEATGASAA